MATGLPENTAERINSAEGQVYFIAIIALINYAEWHTNRMFCKIKT